MSDNKDTKQKVRKQDDLAKQVANIAFTLRKVKNWLEEKMGADIDGDGRIGRGPFKMAVFLCVAGLFASISLAGPANTNIAFWYGTEAAPVTYIDGVGHIMSKAGFVGDGSGITNVSGTGSVLAPAKIWVGNAGSNAAAVTMSDDATIATNGALTISARAVEGSMMPQATDGQLLVGMSVGGSNVVARSITGGISITSNGVVTLTAGSIRQVDSTSDTTNTLYTPAFAGQILAGKTGDTNRCWVATGTTTNDWVAITTP